MKPKKKQKIQSSGGWHLDPKQIFYGLALMAYILIPTFTPNLLALDTNTPKFFATALLNLLVFGVIVSIEDRRQLSGFVGRLFSTNVGMVYALFMVAVLLSFTQAINLSESLLQFMKIFTVFTAVVNLSFILNRDTSFVKIIMIIMTGLLLFDSISVFYYINKFVSGEIPSILEIKTVYSNKNILASAIFVKLPFALYLMVYENGWPRKISWVAFMSGIAATLFLATRAFYLGLIVISFIYLFYYVIYYLRKKDNKKLWQIGSYSVAIIIALISFSIIQSLVYPKDKAVDKYTRSITEQVESIINNDNSTRQRLDAWRWSWELIKENPLFGVGAGNWKVAILKHENQQSDGFIYIYKAHNDFIETATETGLVGGILFLSIFGLIFWNLIWLNVKNTEENSNHQRLYFIAATGLLFYGVDASFNFPADRPEIQVLFAFFVAIGVVSILQRKQKSLENNDMVVRDDNQVRVLIFWSVSGLFTLLMVISSFILYYNFLSTKTQRIVYQEIMSGKLKERSDKIISGFPSIPNVSVWGEPIASIKARYLLDEGKNDQVIVSLKNDFASPFDARREFYMATAYSNLNQIDSALVYALKSHEAKPKYLRNVALIADLLERKGETGKAADFYDLYLQSTKNNLQVWLMASNLYVKSGKMDKASNLIEEASGYFPNDSLIVKQKRFLNFKMNVEVYLPTYNTAMEYYRDKKYSEALRFLNLFIDKVPDDANAYQMRSFTYYFLKNYQACIDDANHSLKIGSKNASLINLRGVSFRQLNKIDAACEDFKMSMKMGNPSGKTNYERYCGGK
jgi:putative inorganic carbon (HCO3(-)) transporter